jgi:hypothetical protein
MSDFNKALNTIKEEIKKEKDKIVEYVTSKSTIFNGTLFDNVYKIETEKELESLSFKAKRGVYVFVMKNQVELNKKFNWTRCGSSLNDGNYVIKDKEILYVGKSKSIKTRLNQHYSNTESSPNSLKLKTEFRKNLVDNFAVYLFTMKDEYKSTKGAPNEAENIILGSVEELLHEYLEPRVGSRRI